MQNPNPSGRNDLDPQETSDWPRLTRQRDRQRRYERAHFPLEALFDKARRTGGKTPFSPNTAYLNTIPGPPRGEEPGRPRDRASNCAAVRWNAAMMVLRGGKKDLEPAATSRRSPPPPRSTTSASTTSGTPSAKPRWRSRSTCRVTARRASMPAPSCSVA